MDFIEYQKNSIRTMAPLNKTYGVETIGNVHGVDTGQLENFKQLPRVLDSVHMAIGMSTEIAELIDAITKEDDVNIAEELADMCWYISGQFHVIGMPSQFDFKSDEINWYPSSTAGRYIQDISHAISAYQDGTKRELAYRKVYDNEQQFNDLHVILMNIGSFAKYLDIDMNQALQNNIDKLRARFPDKFNESDALNRDTDEERKELEK